MTTLYGSDLIVRWLTDIGIRYAACNPGASFRGLHDSLVNAPVPNRPELILCCHEEISVAVAHGYAKATGEPMAVLLHNVIGLQHASMAIYNAWCDRAPVLLLGGTGPMDATKRRPWIDWIHTALVQGQQVRDYVKWDDQPYSLAAVPDALLRARQLMSTPPEGPVYLCFDVDLQEQEADATLHDVSLAGLQHPAPPGPDPRAVETLAQWLSEARAPLLLADLAGQDDAAFRGLVDLAEALGAPVIDLGGRLNFPVTHPLNGTDLKDELLDEADLVVAFDVVDLFGAIRRRLTGDAVPRPAAGLRVVDIGVGDLAVRGWSAAYQRRVAVDLAIPSASGPTLAVLRERLTAIPAANFAGGNPHGARRREIEARIARRRDTREQEAAQALRDPGPLSTPALAEAVRRGVGEEPFILANADREGAARSLLPLHAPRQFLGHEGGAGLGYGLGAGLGAALACRGTERIAVIIEGDGDFLYTPSALWTAARYRLPLLIVVNNNRKYANSEGHALVMASRRGRPAENKAAGTWLVEPDVDFATVARGFGVWAEGPLTGGAAAAEAIHRAATHVRAGRGPALVDVLTV